MAQKYATLCHFLYFYNLQVGACVCERGAFPLSPSTQSVNKQFSLRDPCFRIPHENIGQTSNRGSVLKISIVPVLAEYLPAIAVRNPRNT